MIKRIAYVLNAFPKLSETFVAGELAELRRRNIEVLIGSINSPIDEIQHDLVQRCGLVDATVYGHARFAAALRTFQPQLIHAHFATAPTHVARQLSRLLDVPFSFTAHGYDIYRKPPDDFGERARAASTLITVSDANARWIQREFGVAADRIQVIPCGVDINVFSPTPMRSQPPVILCVARFSPVKNHELLLKSCAALRDIGVTFRCVLIGDGRCRHQIERLVSELRLTPFVHLAGSLEQAEVARWWRQASVGVLSSHSEGMPVSLMEAAACAVPVVATRVGGVPELVEDGVTGFVVDPDDVNGMVRSLESLLANAERWTFMSQASRQRAVARFSICRQVDRLVDVWTESIERQVGA